MKFSLTPQAAAKLKIIGNIFSLFGIALLSLILFFKIFDNIVNIEIINRLGFVFNIDIFLLIFLFVDLAILWKLTYKNGIKNEKYIFWLLIILTAIITTWAIFGNQYQKKDLYDFKINYYYLLVLLGFILLYLNNNKILAVHKNTKSLIDGLSLQDKNERLKERERSKIFPQNFPKINKIPLLNVIFKWMYKEGWIYSIGLIILVLAGLILRLINLTILDPYTDEYAHLEGAKSLNETGIAGYDRAYFLTFLISILFKLFDPSLFVARVPGVVFGALTAIPLYFLGKKINKSVGLISAFLWITSPWALGVSRTIREYAFFPFFILLYLQFLLFYTKKLFKYIINKKIDLRIVLYTIIVFIPFIYGFLIDPLSTFKIFLGTFFVLISYLIFIIYRYLPNRNYKFIMACLIILICLPLAYYALNHKQIDLSSFEINSNFSEIFLSTQISSPMHWYHGTSLPSAIIFLLLFSGLIYYIYKKNHPGLLYFLIFITYILFYTLIFSRYFRPRYIIYELPFYILILASGIYFLFHLIKLFRFKYIYFFLFISIMIFLFSPLNILKAINYNAHGYVPITDEYHDNTKRVKIFLKNKITEDDVFIATIFKHILYTDYNIDKNKIFHYKYTDPERFEHIFQIIKNNKSGWIILESRRNVRWNTGLPLNNFKVGSVQVHLFFNKDNFQIYRW